MDQGFESPRCSVPEGRVRRIPIQLGRVALRSLYYGQAAMLHGVICFVVAPMVEGMGAFLLPYALGMVIAGAYLFYCAYRTPATDLVFADGTIGPDDPALARECIRLDALDIGRCSLSDTSGGRQLVLVAHDSSAVTVASTAEDYPSNGLEPDPRVTIQSVFDVLRGRVPDADPGTASETSTTLVVCPSCHSPVLPDDTAHVQCPYCGGEADMPLAVRESVRASRDLAGQRTLEDAIVRDLLIQPPARDVRRRLGLAVLIILTTWVTVLVAWGVDLSIGTGEVLRFERVVVLVGVGFAISTGCLFLVSAQVEQRRTLRALMFGYGSKPPRAPGTPPCCRMCGAPLHVAVETAVARCAYCGSENIIGLALDGLVASARNQVASLQTVLRDHRTAGKKARAWTVIGMVVLLVSAGAAALGAYLFGSGVADQTERCDRRDIEACAELAQRYLHGDAVPVSRRDARAFAAKACELHQYLTCAPVGRTRRCSPEAASACELAFQLLGESPEGNPRALFEFAAHACSFGEDAMCLPAMGPARTILDTPGSAGKERVSEVLHTWCGRDESMASACDMLVNHGLCPTGIDHSCTESIRPLQLPVNNVDWPATDPLGDPFAP